MGVKRVEASFPVDVQRSCFTALSDMLHVRQMVTGNSKPPASHITLCEHSLLSLKVNIKCKLSTKISIIKELFG